MNLAACRTTGVWRRARVFIARLIVAVSDPYRPERHYMRGPGPKSQASDDRGHGREAD